MGLNSSVCVFGCLSLWAEFTYWDLGLIGFLLFCWFDWRVLLVGLLYLCMDWGYGHFSLPLGLGVVLAGLAVTCFGLQGVCLLDW